MDAKLVAKLRKETNVGVSACNEALKKSGGDFDEAKKILRIEGYGIAERIVGVDTPHGVVASYIHHNGKVGAMVEIRCQTDFTASVLTEFANDICMQIAATNPAFVDVTDVPEQVIEEEKAIIKAQLEGSGKPPNIVEKIVVGKIKKFGIEHCLMEQKYIKDTTIIIREVLNSMIAKTGENIVIKRFSRFHIS